MRTSLNWLEGALRGERKGLLARSLRRAARLGSVGYGAGADAHRLAYQQGVLAVRRLGIPTIAIGNLTAGGTGKTPLVIRLAEDLIDKRQLAPAILLRGYRRARPGRRPVLLHGLAREKILDTASRAGDEATELASRLPVSWIGVHPDRYGAGKAILRQAKPDCFILDDAFQHHRLARDIDVVAIGATANARQAR